MIQQVNKHNKVFRNFLEEHEKEQVREMFWGPYKPEWRLPNGIVDNSDEAIATRLNLSLTAVCQFIVRECEQHWNRVITLREDEWALLNEEIYTPSILSDIDEPLPGEDLIE